HAAREAGRQAQFLERFLIQGGPSSQLRTGRMARNKNGAPVGTVVFRMPIDPRQRLSNILDLVAPGDSRLQTVIDERHAYPPSSVKTPNVAVRIGASKLQCFVAPPPTAAMNEDQDWPAGALGNIEVQTMLARACRWIGPLVQVLVP